MYSRSLNFLFGFIRKFKRKYSFIIISFCLFLFNHPLSASAADLMQVFKLACENDSTFQKEIYTHEASPEIYRQAFAGMLPVLGADAFYQKSKHKILDNEVSVYSDTLARYPSKGFNLVLSQPLFEYSSMIRVAQAKEEVKRADLKFQAAGQDLILRVTEAYLRALEAGDVLRFSRAEEEAVRLHFDLAKERYENGLVPITDFHDAKARLAGVTTKRVRAEHNMEDAIEGLAEITGGRVESLKGIGLPDIYTDEIYSEVETENIRREYSESVVSNRFNSLSKRPKGVYEGDSIPLVSPDPDTVDKWVEAAKKQNFNILMKEKDLVVAEKEIKRQNGGHFPTLSLVGRYNRDVEGGSLYGGGSDVEKWEGAVELKIPLFNGFSTSSKKREARFLYKAAQQELETEIRSVTRDLKASFLGIKSSIENIKALRQAIVSSQIALDGKKEGFKSGLLPSLAVTDAERDLFQTKHEYAKSQYEYIIYSLRLKKAVGLLRQEDIQEVNSWLD